MKYIVQTNLINTEDLNNLRAALDEVGVEQYPVKIIPFNYDEVEGEPEPGFFSTQDVVVFGSVTLTKVAMRKGWGPGVWAGADFTYRNYIRHYGEAMLNADAITYKFSRIPKFDGDKFIRPIHDNKAFTGRVINGKDLETWQADVIDHDIHTFANTRVMVADVKDIICEYRFFIVAGKVITGSLYNAYGMLAKRELEMTYSADVGAWEFAQEQVDNWNLAEAFVMDIALMKDYSYRIVEINGMNAAGFYCAKISDIIRALEDIYSGNVFNFI